MLTGTRNRLPAGSSLAGYTAVRFGWGRGCYTNRSTGVCILLGKRFQPRMIKEVSFPSWTRRIVSAERRYDGSGHPGVLLAPFWWMQWCLTEGSSDGFSTIDGLDKNLSFELVEQGFHDCSW